MLAKLFLALLALQGALGDDTTTVTLATTTTTSEITTTTVPSPADVSTTTTTQAPQQTTTPDPNANKLYIRILRAENPSGTLQDGKTACSEFAFAGEQCTMSLKVGVSLGGDNCALGNVNALQYGNVADIQPPQKITLNQTNGVFAGFNLCAQLVDPNGQIIADFKDTTDDSKTRGIKTLYTDTGAAIKFAWNSHAAAAPPPTTTPVVTTAESTTAGPSGTTGEPATTTAPIIASDCDDFPDRQNGVKTIYIADQPVNVSCQYGAFSGALTTIQSRGEIEDNTDFTSNFSQYKEQFGTAGKGNNFWLGLENMVNLTNSGKYNLFIEVCCGNTSIAQQRYLNFVIGDKDSGYVLNATAPDDLATRGLGLLAANTVGRRDIGTPFLTSQTYEDTYSGEMEFCEVIEPNEKPNAKNTGGWWFGSCANNLNGAYIKATSDDCKVPSDYPDGTGIAFRNSTGTTDPEQQSYLSGISFTRARMAVFRSDIPLQGIPVDDFCSGI